MMNLQVNYTLEEALDFGWKTLAECFERHEVGIKQTLIDKYWPKVSELKVAEMKLTKTELRAQQLKFERLRKYLPTLQLKKAMLQMEVNQAQIEIEALAADFGVAHEKVAKYSALLTERSAPDLFSAVTVHTVERSYENIAGVDIPIFENVQFEPATYSLFDTPVWFESAIGGIKELITAREKIKIAEEKKRALGKRIEGSFHPRQPF